MDKKIQKRIDDMFNNADFDEEFLELTLKDEVEKKLFDYQILHVFNLITALKRKNVIIDGSSVGTGKTYTAIAVCKQQSLIPYIICPKSVVSMWENTCRYFDIIPLSIVNYETLKSGYEYEEGKRVDSKFLKKTEDGEYYWTFKNRNILLIFDEVHKCKNTNTSNGKLLLASKNKCKVLMLSATICDKIENFIPFGYMLGLYKTLDKGKNWIDGVIRECNSKLGSDGQNLKIVTKYLYPDYGSQMTIEDIGKKFPVNQISAECYDITNDEKKSIDKYYDSMGNIKKSKNTNGKDTNVLATLNKLRMGIETIKISIMKELMDKYYEQNRSVVLFVNFTDSLKELEKYCIHKKIHYSTIHGEQKAEERTLEIENFQKNKTRVMISMIQAGGTGVSLHDLTGKFPRVSIISPSYSSIELLQALGRIHRAGTKSPVLQRIVYCAGTCEERLCDIIRGKLKFISNLTDEDLQLF